MFHWPCGPSIFEPDWWTGQMFERSSGTEGGRVNVEGGGCVIVSLSLLLCLCVPEEQKRKYGINKRGVGKGAAR